MKINQNQNNPSLSPPVPEHDIYTHINESNPLSPMGKFNTPISVPELHLRN